MKTNTLTEPIETPFKPLQEGTYTYYTIESRLTHKTPPYKPQLKPQKLKTPDNWTTNIVNETIAEPWTGTGNNIKPKYKSHEETTQVKNKTGRTGWWTLKNAIKAKNRLQKANKNNKLTWEDPCGKLTDILKYEFRIIKITISKTKEVLTTTKPPAKKQKLENIKQKLENMLLLSFGFKRTTTTKPPTKKHPPHNTNQTTQQKNKKHSKINSQRG